ncbi:ATP-binding protein [Rummeliibacillus sp. JY-2-4R]
MEGSKEILFETLLINFLFLLIPFLVYFVFFETKNLKNFKLILTLFATITMILCMSYPIHLQSGFIFDLRYIPFAIITLYFGYKNALISYIILNLYRFIIGGEGIIQSFLFSTIIFIIIAVLSGKYRQLKANNRVFFASMVASFTMVVYLITLSFQTPMNREFYILSINAIGTHLILTGVMVSLIERVLSNLKERELFIQSERYQVISELSASVAHEIRNPLTATHGFLQLLNDSESIPSKEKTYIDFSLKELNRAENIVSDFLSFSKPQCENVIETDLQNEIEYALNILKPYANMHNVNFQFRFENTLNIALDKSQIQQCLINLIKNGIEAMQGHGGTLTINTTNIKSNIVLKISDTGIGMTDEEIESLGKPYYSTKKQGTGLGMVMVYNAINKIGGTIIVESKKGSGTTFNIVIPV